MPSKWVLPPIDIQEVRGNNEAYYSHMQAVASLVNVAAEHEPFRARVHPLPLGAFRACVQ